MTKTDNPASRLIAILEKAHAIHQEKGAVPNKVGWAYVFEIPTDGGMVEDKYHFELFSRLFQYIKLIDDTEAALRSIEGINTARYLAPFPAIRNTVNLTALDEMFRPSRVDATHMVILGFCEEKLAEYHGEPKIEEEQLKVLLDDVNALYEDVLASSSLHEKLKSLVLEQLEHIRRAIHEYRIRGAERLREELVTLVGSYVLNKDLIEQEGDKKEVRRFQHILSNFAATVAFASHTTRLIEAAATYLPKLLPGS
jgi:hypothetical protein